MLNFCNSCGGGDQAGPGYLVKKDKETPKFYPDLAAVSQKELSDPGVSMFRVTKSPLESQLAQLKFKGKAFIDPEFPPNETSLGQFDSINIDRWKRISEIVEKPQLFGPEIQPKQATISNYPIEKGFQAATACLI
jgi:hypothetical protein